MIIVTESNLNRKNPNNRNARGITKRQSEVSYLISLAIDSIRNFPNAAGENSETLSFPLAKPVKAKSQITFAIVRFLHRNFHDSFLSQYDPGHFYCEFRRLFVCFDFGRQQFDPAAGRPFLSRASYLCRKFFLRRQSDFRDLSLIR